MQSRFGKALAIVGIWAVLGSMLTLEVYFTTKANGQTLPLLDIAEWQFKRAVFWAVLAPLVLLLREIVPLQAGRWFGGVSFHVVASLFFMAAYYLARVLLIMVKDLTPLNEFWDQAQRGFFGRNLIDALFYWSVLAFGYMSDLNQRSRNHELRAAQLEARLVQAEMTLLKQQLQPHFLFNTLNTIAVLVREQRNKEAVHLIARLGTLLRQTLEHSTVHEVTLQTELEFLRSYLDIQQARFEHKFTVNFEVAPESLLAKVPNLVLQPVVENAVLHGLGKLADGGRLDIGARIESGRLHLEIADNGPGFSHEAGAVVKEGVGLSVTRGRLERLYGTRSQMVLRSEAGRGVRVLLTLPFEPFTPTDAVHERNSVARVDC